MRRLVIVVALLFVLFASVVAVDVVGGDDEERRSATAPLLADDRLDEVTDALRRERAFREGLPSRSRADEGVVFRAVLPDGEMVSLSEDGRVVVVSDTTVTSSTDDYRTLRLDAAGTEELAGLVFEGLLEPGEDTGLSVFHGGGFVHPARSSLTDPLRDLSWLGEHVVEPLGPWVPEELSVEAHAPLPSPPSPLRDHDPFAPWPLPVRVDELPHAIVQHPYGERLAICLTGADVVPVFALLTGVNHAYLRVDDGRRWELNVTVHSPGYRIHGSACDRQEPAAAE